MARMRWASIDSWVWMIKGGKRGSERAASRARNKPRVSATSRSRIRPASVERRPPWKSAETVLEPRLEKRMGGELQSVIAIALLLEGWDCSYPIRYKQQGHRARWLSKTLGKYPG